ncbi:16S rRNA (guanine(527)-N(7))-methyltransferase RsmG [Methylohalomonas lacus]|uniref:16S rRNA (guanine(527)-N(7))-methyltransferase RsmG n=1 Tax=Methylohalomonas lacus TaxID=398773 RepID=UPI0021691AA4|nr:16S rRNA (guanine(527)-N(7))-methyltransferase RsmG [Methylohalomonas lacus]
MPQAALLDYLELLVHWNQAYNLTAVRDPQAMVAYHLLDSLSLLPHLRESDRRCLDIGTGAGLPGVVLALARPDQHWVLLDSNSKKTRFLQQVRMQLDLNNIEVVRERVTEYAPEALFDVVSARALAGLDKLCRWAQPLLAPGGRLLAMKAAPDAGELDSVVDLSIDYRGHELSVPGVDGPRSLIELWFNT